MSTSKISKSTQVCLSLGNVKKIRTGDDEHHLSIYGVRNYRFLYVFIDRKMITIDNTTDITIDINIDINSIDIDIYINNINIEIDINDINNDVDINIETNIDINIDINLDVNIDVNIENIQIYTGMLMTWKCQKDPHRWRCASPIKKLSIFVCFHRSQ